jgi:hypothetical protein
MKEDAEKYQAMAKPVATAVPKRITGKQMLMYGNIEYETPSAMMFCQIKKNRIYRIKKTPIFLSNSSRFLDYWRRWRPSAAW